MSSPILSRYIGDNATLALNLIHPDTRAPFDPTGYELIFTLKECATDDDSLAFMEKSVGNGITVTNAAAGTIAVSIVPSDWKGMIGNRVYVFDVQAQHMDTAAVYTVCLMCIEAKQDVRRGTSLPTPDPDPNPENPAPLVDFDGDQLVDFDGVGLVDF